MNISGIINDLDAVSSKLSKISSDVANMVIIDGNVDTTRDMKEKLHEVMVEINSISDIIETNKATIQSCCDTLGLNVNYYSSSGGGGRSSYGGSVGSRSITYNAIR